jgi:putative ubiquitin-RnfH superfamily antitoxin RatB of RatAB toxin-antitoxin module
MGTLRVEVVYAAPESADAVSLTLPGTATLREAIAASGLLERHPDIDLARQKCGVFGKLRPLDAPLRDGDRVEIYRPLAVDPKEARRRRARAPRV